MYQSGDHDQELVHVPDGFALVPLDRTADIGRATVPEWLLAVPPFDPQSGMEHWWSLLMRWPRRTALAFLYCSLSWRRSAVVMAVVIALIMTTRAYA